MRYRKSGARDALCVSAHQFFVHDIEMNETLWPNTPRVLKPATVRSIQTEVTWPLVTFEKRAIFISASVNDYPK